MRLVEYVRVAIMIGFFAYIRRQKTVRKMRILIVGRCVQLAITYYGFSVYRIAMELYA